MNAARFLVAIRQQLSKESTDIFDETLIQRDLDAGRDSTPETQIDKVIREYIKRGEKIQANAQNFAFETMAIEEMYQECVNIIEDFDIGDKRRIAYLLHCIIHFQYYKAW